MPSLFRPLALLGAAVGALLAGCTIGPAYAPPVPPAPGSTAFIAAAPSGAAFSDPSDPPAMWWRLYETPALDALVAEALVHNASLRQAEASLVQSRAALDLARSQRYPATALSAGAQYGVSSTQLLVGKLAGAGTPAPVGFYSLGFDASYEVDLFGRIHRAVQAAAADRDAARAAEDVTRVSVAGETTHAYLDACAYAEARKAAETALKVTTETFQLTLTQERYGAASAFDVARARQAVDQARAAPPAFEAQRRGALFALAVLTGRPPEEISGAADACAAPPHLTRPLPSGDVQGLLRRRPDVREAERRLAANVARIGVATGDLYPRITIGGSVGSGAATPSGLFRAANLTYGVGPMLSWSFPNTLAAQAEVRSARAAASGTYAAFEAAVLQALQDAESALTTYGAELDRNRALSASLTQSETALRLARVQYLNGAASLLDVLSAQSVYAQALQSLAGSDEAVASDQVTAFKALGGGWAQAPDVTAPGITDRRTGKTTDVR